MAKIMVVDDEVDLVRLVSKILQARGHTVVTAANGQEAMASLRQHEPDVVILDVNLPHLNGFEVCRLIKANPDTSHIPVVMITAAYVQVEDAHYGASLGADEYVVKPFLREVLVHNVERLLPRHQRPQAS